ncbi:MAG: acyl carrier protein [Deltaproteobacteria bacterium]|nr:acyl carrier protein [Deltaproteobacteria bacterium]
MIGAHNVSDIKQAIKEMLVKRLKLKMDAASIKDDAPLFGDAGLGLDSIDALELVVGLQKEYGVVINDKAVAERVLVSVNTIAEHVSANKTA